MIDVRLPEQTRDQLTRLKRATGIKTWNTLCRWAFCASLAEEETIEGFLDNNEGAIEMRWDVFGGEYQHTYQAILADECYKIGQEVNDRNLGRLARQHIQRGASLLVNKYKISSIEDLIRIAGCLVKS